MGRQKAVELYKGGIFFLTGSGVAVFCGTTEENNTNHAEFEIIWPKKIVTITVGKVSTDCRQLDTFNPGLYHKILTGPPIRPRTINESLITKVTTSANPEEWTRLIADLHVTISRTKDPSGKLAPLMEQLIGWLASAWSVSINSVDAARQAQEILAWLSNSASTKNVCHKTLPDVPKPKQQTQPASVALPRADVEKPRSKATANTQDAPPRTMNELVTVTPSTEVATSDTPAAPAPTTTTTPADTPPEQPPAMAPVVVEPVAPSASNPPAEVAEAVAPVEKPSWQKRASKVINRSLARITALEAALATLQEEVAALKGMAASPQPVPVAKETEAKPDANPPFEELAINEPIPPVLRNARKVGQHWVFGGKPGKIPKKGR